MPSKKLTSGTDDYVSGLTGRNGSEFSALRYQPTSIWCFRKGCSTMSKIVPQNSVTGTSYEVIRFKSLLAGLIYYIHTISLS